MVCDRGVFLKREDLTGSRLRITAALLGAALLGLGWTLVPSPARAASPGFASTPVAMLTYDVAAGTGGGSNTGGVWTTRALNTELYAPDAGRDPYARISFTTRPWTSVSR